MTVEDNVFSEINSPMLTIYREIGTLQGRVSALEDTSKEIKAILSSMTLQLSSIQNSVSSVLGNADGKSKAYDRMGLIVNILIAAITAFIMVKYGR